MQNFLLYMTLFCACISTHASSYEELLENNKLVTIANEMDGISTGFIVLRSSNMDHITNQDLKNYPHGLSTIKSKIMTICWVV